jgi:hypothetical protein
VQPASTLPELVDQLGRTYSPFERLKILGRAWGLLRKMSPEQRMIVAAQLGLDHADEVVEAIAKRSGQKASPALISMIEKAQMKGTPHLPELIADLRDPQRRGERLKQGALAVGDALAADAVPEAQWLPPGAAPPDETRPPAPARPSGAPRPAPAPPAPPPVQPAPQPVQAQPVPQPAAPPPAPAPAALPAAAPAQPAPPPLPAPEIKPQESAPRPEPVAVRPAAPPAQRLEPAGDGALAARLAAAPALTARFRLLRRHLDEARGVSAAGLGSLLETFPDGWARRRALLELLRAGVPAALDDVFALIETLGSDRDRLWCLGTLAESREIPEQDREAFLAAASSPTARRRLERRLGGD